MSRILILNRYRLRSAAFHRWLDPRHELFLISCATRAVDRQPDADAIRTRYRAIAEIDALLGRNEPDYEIRSLLRASVGRNLALDCQRRSARSTYRTWCRYGQRVGQPSGFPWEYDHVYPDCYQRGRQQLRDRNGDGHASDSEAHSTARQGEALRVGLARI